MTVSSVPKFFGFSVVSDGYIPPASKADCLGKFGDDKDPSRTGYYESVRNTLAQKLANIFNKNFPDKCNCSDENCKCGQFPIREYDCKQECNSLYKSIFKDICDDSIESNIAYKFYVNQIIKKINELNSYITEAQAILANYTDNKLTRLQILDTFCKKIEIEFSYHYAYDPEEDVFKIIEEEKSASEYASTQLENKHTNYADLRKDKIPTYPGSSPKSKIIECFNELNLLDRLKYIKLYYDCNSGKTDSLFPNNEPEEAYPAVSVPKSTAYNQETYTTGQLELFYIGYLIDRDGPIGALCSFIEFKSIALLKNIEIESLRIKAINTYLAYLTKASMYLNGRSKDTGVPKTTYAIVVLVCNGFARGIKQLSIDGETVDYLILQRDNDDSDNKTKIVDGYHISGSGYYLLVRVDAGASTYIEKYASDSPYFSDRMSKDDALGNSVNVKDPFTNAEFSNVTFYNGFKYDTEIDCKNTANKEVLLARISNDNDYSHHKNFLPKELDITTITMNSIYGCGSNDISWGTSKTKDNKESYNRMITAWQDAIDNYIGNLNTTLETINSDIDVWKSKMNTWDSLANKIRHRDYEIRQNLISRALR